MVLRKWICAALVLCLPILFSCKTSQVDQQKKRIEQQKELKDAETLKRYGKALKHHQEIQSKATRKRMKGNMNSAYHAPSKKKFFLFRIFNKKKDTPCPASRK